MTLKDLVVRWDNAWRYDYWWRQRHNIPFNSNAHRAVSQLDIAFEYMENYLSNKELEKYKDDEHKKEELKKTGQWIKYSIDNEKITKAFEKIDLKDF